MVEVSREELLHQSPEQAVTGVTRSPEGEPCVGMALGGKLWIHLMNAGDTMGIRAKVQLREEFGANPVVGFPIDVDSSLATGNVELLATAELEKGKITPVVGIYVDAELYDGISTFLFKS
ncbi:MAG: hypothetical protein Q7T54_00730 [Candidatus Levybacteria bacterium]|nr:hypothetical protein [Candidatus Levybacteria bacterium]